MYVTSRALRDNFCTTSQPDLREEHGWVQERHRLAHGKQQVRLADSNLPKTCLCELSPLSKVMCDRAAHVSHVVLESSY